MNGKKPLNSFSHSARCPEDPANWIEPILDIWEAFTSEWCCIRRLSLHFAKESDHEATEE